jgi:serine/threonine protein kinase
LARVAHPNVITIYGAESMHDRVGLWMEFIKGFTLEDLLAQQGPYSPREATFIGLDLCRALAAVHTTGLVHRDVKAANVMREHGGTHRADGLRHRPGSQVRLGRKAEWPVRRCTSRRKFSAARRQPVRSDLYSLGVLLYRLTTGAYPVNGTTLRDLADAHRQGRFVRMRDVRPTLPNAFVNIVERALSKQPDHRYESAGAMDAALAGWLGIGQRDVHEPMVRTPREPIDAVHAGDARASEADSLRQPVKITESSRRSRRFSFGPASLGRCRDRDGVGDRDRCAGRRGAQAETSVPRRQPRPAQGFSRLRVLPLRKSRRRRLFRGRHDGSVDRRPGKNRRTRRHFSAPR